VDVLDLPWGHPGGAAILDRRLQEVLALLAKVAHPRITCNSVQCWECTEWQHAPLASGSSVVRVRSYDHLFQSVSSLWSPSRYSTPWARQHAAPNTPQPTNPAGGLRSHHDKLSKVPSWPLLQLLPGTWPLLPQTHWMQYVHAPLLQSSNHLYTSIPQHSPLLSRTAIHDINPQLCPLLQNLRLPMTALPLTGETAPQAPHILCMNEIIRGRELFSETFALSFGLRSW